MDGRLWICQESPRLRIFDGMGGRKTRKLGCGAGPYYIVCFADFRLIVKLQSRQNRQRDTTNPVLNDY
jgi:hypothetical protein